MAGRELGQLCGAPAPTLIHIKAKEVIEQIVATRNGGKHGADALLLEWVLVGVVQFGAIPLMGSCLTHLTYEYSLGREKNPYCTNIPVTIGPRKGNNERN